MKTYEGLYIFDDGLRDDDLDAAIEQACEVITRLGGSTKSKIPMGRKTFARPIGRREMGQYVRIVFELSPDQVAPLRARYRLMDNVVRVQIVVGDETSQTAADTEADDKD